MSVQLRPAFEQAETYRARGWVGRIPLPPGAKWPPPSGFTGGRGRWPGPSDLEQWRREGYQTRDETGRLVHHDAVNLALRLAEAVVGLDVDAYGDKPGARTLADLEDRLGPLPATWRTTSRGDGTSGIRLYTAPTGLSWPTEAGPGIEVIRYAHRYAVVWPSQHPEGGTYRWVAPDGTPSEPPRARDLPALPDGWVAYLTGGQLNGQPPARPGSRAAQREAAGTARAWLAGLDTAEPCPYVGRLAADTMGAARREDGAAFDHTRDVVMALLRAAEQGHRGVGKVLPLVRDAYVAGVKDRAPQAVAEGEFDRFAEGAVAKIAATPSLDVERDCRCPSPETRRSAPTAPVDPPGTLAEAGEPLGDHLLPIRRLADVAAEVDARGPRHWLIRGLWPAGDYGVHGAEPKAGKTWNAADLAVSVASGTPWLGAVPIDTPGPVILFAGEGGDGNVVRRLRAVAAAHGLIADHLDIWVCTRAPHLSDSAHLAILEDRVQRIGPALVTLDPLYLAARGANGADLYAMGQLLERPQHICQRAGSSLLVVTHFNRNRDAKGSGRLTGAGPAEWGRVLIAGTVVSRHTDKTTKATTVLVELDVTGGEIPDQTLRVRRFVRADDPDDLDSPLTYTVDMPDADEPQAMPAGADLAPAAVKLLEAVEARQDPSTIAELVDHIVERHGHGLKRQTCSTHLNALRDRGLVDCLDPGPGRDRLWFRVGGKGDAA